MLLDVLKKIESGDLNFTPRELKLVVPYAYRVLYHKPELVSELIQHVPQSERFNVLGDWFTHAARVIGKGIHTPENVSRVAEAVLQEMASADEGEKDLLADAASSLFGHFFTFGRNGAAKALWQAVSDYKGEEWTVEHLLPEQAENGYALSSPFAMSVLQGDHEMSQWLIDRVTASEQPDRLRNLLRQQGAKALTSIATTGKVENAHWVVDAIKKQEFGVDMLKEILLEEDQFKANRPIVFSLAISNGHIPVAEFIYDLAGELGGADLQKQITEQWGYGEFVAAARKGNMEAMTWLFDLHQTMGGDERIVKILERTGPEIFSSLMLRGEQEAMLDLVKLAREKGGQDLAEKLIKVDEIYQKKFPDRDPLGIALQVTTMLDGYAPLLAVAEELGGKERVLNLIREDDFELLRRTESFDVLSSAFELGGKELALKAIHACEGSVLSRQFCKFINRNQLDEAREVLELAREVGGEALLQETLGTIDKLGNGTQTHDPYVQIMRNLMLGCNDEWRRSREHNSPLQNQLGQMGEKQAQAPDEGRLHYAGQVLDLLEEYGGREKALKSLTGDSNVIFQAVCALSNREIANYGHERLEQRGQTLRWMVDRVEQMGGKDAALEMLLHNAPIPPQAQLQDWWYDQMKTRLAEAPDPENQRRYDLALVSRAREMMDDDRVHRVLLADIYSHAFESGGVALLKECVDSTLSWPEHLRYNAIAADAVALAGLAEHLPVLDITLSLEEQATLAAHLEMPKHSLWQKIGTGNGRWKAIFNQYAPYGDLEDESPFKFSNKVYQQILPKMALISEMEDAGTEELWAYKLAVMFSSAQEAERYLERAVNDNNFETHQPVHDALLFEIPKNGQWNPQLWKDMLLKFGPRGGKYIGLAPRIESYLAREGLEFPKTLQEMNDVASQIVYERARENPEFARIAGEVGLSEPTFEEGLDIIAKKSKTRDNLPDIFIDGADIGHPTFYMQKLAPGDPTGLLLGELTNCCQHIGDAGRSCAIHGFSSEDGGFYVWKHKTKGEITDSDTIVAQSWAWRGNDPRTGEDVLVFDSFERLGKEYNPLMLPFMEQFAHETQGHAFSNKGKDPSPMTLVLMGAGGATPKQKDMMTMWPATPVDYTGYRDSKNQYEITPRQHRKQAEKLAGWAARETARQDNAPERGAMRA